MTWLAWTVLYIALHFCVYALILRNRPVFTRESLIFLLHLVSEIAWPAVLILGGMIGLWPQGEFSTVIAVLSLHGIYSLSFLSLWSLASGGYSLAILEYVQSCGGAGVRVNTDALAHIGTSKQQARLEGIQRLGLIRANKTVFQATPRGHISAFMVGALAWILGIPASG